MTESDEWLLGVFPEAFFDLTYSYAVAMPRFRKWRGRNIYS